MIATGSVGQTAAVLISAIGLFIVIATAIIVVARAKGGKDSIDILVTANEGLRTANADLEDRLLSIRHDFEVKLLEQDKDCQRQLAEVKGQLSVLMGSLAKDIALAVVNAVKDGDGDTPKP